MVAVDRSQRLMTELPTDSFTLTGRTLIVTGASSGIGQAVASLCARLGARLVLNGRSAERLAQTAASLAGEGHVEVAGDLNDAAVRDALLDAAPQFDGFASCAGVTALVPARMAAEKHLMQMLSVNYLAPAALVQRLLQKKKLRDGASLVFVTALSARAAPAATAGYAASKAALEAFSRTVALEHARQRIRANCVAPGYVDTPMLQALGLGSDQTDLTPLGMATTDDVAPSVAYLLSPASGWVTRSTLTVDGGISVRIRL
jgi:NAD(P)-dependent dehydrogenase (short-subunit alcohol dehydrogenase family)